MSFDVLVTVEGNVHHTFLKACQVLDLVSKDVHVCVNAKRSE